MTTARRYFLKRMPAAVSTSFRAARLSICSRVMSASLSISGPLPKSVWETNVNTAHKSQTMRKSHDASEQVGYDKNESDYRCCFNAVCIVFISGYCTNGQ